MRANAFIAGDWGTTQLRLFLCSGSEVLETSIGAGLAASQRGPQEGFAELANGWLTTYRITNAVLCGMVGSRTGWRETAYAPCPASLDDLIGALGRVQHRELAISIVPGVSCVSPLGTPDVMRGEETQIFGALQLQPQLARGRHILALPGTHSKWVIVEGGRIVGFQTALTGELFALLRSQSTLLKAGSAPSNAFDSASFEKGLKQATDGALLHRLFQVRSRQLIDGMSADHAAALLSGLLIGSDVDTALRSMATDHVTLICEPALADLYATALRTRSIAAQRLDGSECVLAGLRAFATA